MKMKPTEGKSAIVRTARKKERATSVPLSAKTESALWVSLEPTATAAVDFWVRFMDMRKAGNGALSTTETANLLRIVRAVSWVESRHGTGTGSSPAVDPMQCSNPADAWWPQVIGKGTMFDRYVGGPSAKNYHANELAAAVTLDAVWPAKAKLDELVDRSKGHRDAKFNNIMGFHWAVPHLFWKINAKAGGRPFYRFDNVTRLELLDGADEYNGGGDPAYRSKVDQALTEAGWPARDTRDDEKEIAFFQAAVQGTLDSVAKNANIAQLFPDGHMAMSVTLTLADQRQLTIALQRLSSI